MRIKEKPQISIQEFTEKYFPEMMKNTFHADFIKWIMSDESKLTPKTRILNFGVGRPVLNGIKATHIIIDDLTSKTP